MTLDETEVDGWLKGFGSDYDYEYGGRDLGGFRYHIIKRSTQRGTDMIIPFSCDRLKFERMFAEVVKYFSFFGDKSA